MAQKKTPAKKTPAAKAKRKPAALSTVQQDAVQSVRDRKLDSVTEKLKTGKIDHGSAASPTKGVLDPREFDKFEVETRATLTETQRIQKVIVEHLNEEYSRGGKYQWTCGFFLETDARAKGESGYKALTEEMVGKAWSTQLRSELGLTIYNGALCWNGRGTFERHIICVKTKQLQKRQILANEEASMQALTQLDVTADGKKNRFDIKEKVKKLPVIPMNEPQDGQSVESGTMTQE